MRCERAKRAVGTRRLSRIDEQAAVEREVSARGCAAYYTVLIRRIDCGLSVRTVSSGPSDVRSFPRSQALLRECSVWLDRSGTRPPVFFLLQRAIP